jgi:DNA replication protein DnaC
VGDFSHWVLPSPEDCPACKEQEERAAYVDALFERFSSMGIPTEHQEWTLGWESVWSSRPDEDYNQPTFRAVLERDRYNGHAYKACLQYKCQGWLAFGGGVGTGKTTMATSLMMDMIEANRWRYRKPVWTTEANLFRQCDMAAATDHPARVKELHRHLTAGLLLIDDLAASRRPLTDWQGGAMRDLFDHRYINKLPTFFTTNLTSWDDLAKRYGKHVVSRMVSRCKTLVLMSGPDRRMEV